MARLLSEVSREVHSLHPRVLRRQSLDSSPRAVRAGIVDHDDLEIVANLRDGLAQPCIELRQARAAPINRRPLSKKTGVSAIRKCAASIPRRHCLALTFGIAVTYCAHRSLTVTALIGAARVSKRFPARKRYNRNGTWEEHDIAPCELDREPDSGRPLCRPCAAQKSGVHYRGSAHSGLGIGANTAVFSGDQCGVVAQTALRRSERLVSLRQQFPKLGEASLGTCPAEYLDYRDRTRAFSSMAGYENAVFDLTGGPSPSVSRHSVPHTPCSPRLVCRRSRDAHSPRTRINPAARKWSF